MSNNNNTVDNRGIGKKIFDKISLSVLKVEAVVMVGVILACVFKVTTTFIL